MKLNPYEKGQSDYKDGLKSMNPYPEFSAKWGLYNRGYNTGAGWPFFNPKQTDQDKGRAQ